jgi:hypothetical protein
MITFEAGPAYASGTGPVEAMVEHVHAMGLHDRSGPSQGGHRCQKFRQI